MNVLVTGGAGYIGSHTCKALASSGYVPVVYDNLSSGHRDSVRWGPFEHGDILDSFRLNTIMRAYAIQGVVHFAALAYVGESVTVPDRYYQINVAGTLSLLQAMRNQHVSRIVVSSSCTVYGQPDEVPITEDCPLRPVNPYGFTKSVMERMLDDYGRAFDFKSVALRYFNAAGADKDGDLGERHDPETHLIPRVLMAASGRIPFIEIFGDDYPTPDGTCIRDYVHVTDLAAAHVRALDHLFAGKDSARFNVGMGKGYSVREVIDTAERVLGRPIPKAVRVRREGDPPCLTADASRIRETLQWSPEHSDLENILRTASRTFGVNTRSI